MALGGIHDHLGGGFHRYSTDAEWLVPHFEKMLYDNAQLLGVYARAWTATGRDLFRRTAVGIGDYLLREMRGPEGGFFAATDADSEGEEGKFFVWTADEIRDVLGEGDGAFFCEWYGVRPGGNFLDEATGRSTGLNILHLSKEPPPEAEERLRPLREALRLARSRRVPPLSTTSVFPGGSPSASRGSRWPAGRSARRGTSTPRGRRPGSSSTRCVTGRGASSGRGRTATGKIPAFLEDEAYLANALLDLAESVPPSESGEWLDEAGRCVESLRRRFGRGDGPGFSLAGEGHEALLATSRDFFDKATPSASGSAARALARLARRTRDAALALEAAEAASEVSWLMTRSPHGTESWFFVLEELLAFETSTRTPASATSSRFGRTEKDRRRPKRTFLRR